MARYIDADVAEKIIAEKAKEPNYQHEGEDWKFGLCMAETTIEETPTADVVEVRCRCKDCKHYRQYGKTSLVINGKNVNAGWCMLRAKSDEEHRMLPFDFCSYGERKECYEANDET